MKKTGKRLMTALIAVAVVIMATATVFAAIYFLAPSRVAKGVGDDRLAEVFANGGGVIFDLEAQESMGYTIDILGMASGSNLSTYTDTDTEMTYIVGAISKTNGEAMTDYADIMLTPLVSDYEPMTLNIFTLADTAKRSFLYEGVEYFVMESNNLEIFADHTVYIAAYEGVAPNAEIFQMNDDGEIAFNSAYGGVKALFTIPFDSALADTAAAATALVTGN